MIEKEPQHPIINQPVKQKLSEKPQLQSKTNVTTKQRYSDLFHKAIN